MADWTKTQLADKTLEYLGVKAAGQSASAEDNALAQEVAQSVYEQLRKTGLAPFAISAVPEWAQMQLKKIIAADLCGNFGISGQRRVEYMQDKMAGIRELAVQCAGYKHPIPVRAKYF